MIGEAEEARLKKEKEGRFSRQENGTKSRDGELVYVLGSVFSWGPDVFCPLVV